VDEAMEQHVATCELLGYIAGDVVKMKRDSTYAVGQEGMAHAAAIRASINRSSAGSMAPATTPRKRSADSVGEAAATSPRKRSAEPDYIHIADGGARAEATTPRGSAEGNLNRASMKGAMHQQKERELLVAQTVNNPVYLDIGAAVRCAFSTEIYTRGCHWFPHLLA
jgi:hypothetical protein